MLVAPVASAQATVQQMPDTMLSTLFERLAIGLFLLSRHVSCAVKSEALLP